MTWKETGIQLNYYFTDLQLALGLGCEVCPDVELREEEEEHDGVRADEVGELPGEVAVVVEDELEAVDHDADELDHLQVGHVLLPPNELLEPEI